MMSNFSDRFTPAAFRGIALALAVAVFVPPAHHAFAQECGQAEDGIVRPVDSIGGRSFGGAVALEGDRLVVGAQKESQGAGAVYVFRFEGGTWTEKQKLAASDARPFAAFGQQVALDGDTIAVASIRGAYVFDFDGTGWTETQKIVPEGGDVPTAFGSSIGLSGDVLVASSAFEGERESMGAAYVFRRDGNLFQQEARLESSDIATGDYFGSAVDVLDDVLVAVARGDFRGGGVAYVFRDIGSEWVEEQSLAPAGIDPSDRFPSSLDLDHDAFVIGATGLNDPADSGGAFVFRRYGSSWWLEQVVTSSDGGIGDNFGGSVALSGSTLIVGSPFDNTGAVHSGSAYIYVHNGVSWVGERKIAYSLPEVNGVMGSGVATDGARAVVGIPGLTEGGVAAVYTKVDVPQCAAGTVDLGTCQTADVLSVNGSTGGDSRTVGVAIGAPFTLELAAAPAGPDPATYVGWAWAMPAETHVDLAFGSDRIGCTVNPTPLSVDLAPLPIRCFAGAGVPPRFCAGTPTPQSPATAPFVIEVPNGIAAPGAYSIQFLMRDDGAGSSRGASISNAITVVVN